MNKERTKVGDMRINKDTMKPEVCVEVSYHANGWVESEWADYEKNLLKTKLGMSPESHQLHSLQHFIDVLNVNQPIEQKDTIKIRYAYITSPTNMIDSPGYCETITFRVVALDALEGYVGIKELLARGDTLVIKILGRHLCTGRVDMDGKDIYEGDIIRWYPNIDRHIYEDKTVDINTNFYELEPEKYCKVIGTIYDKLEDI